MKDGAQLPAYDLDGSVKLAPFETAKGRFLSMGGNCSPNADTL